MGYNSTFSGSFTPSRPIPDEVIQKINDMDLDLVVCTDSDMYDTGDVIPVCCEMHGYSLDEDAVRIQAVLANYGITLSGTIDRTGESSDDFERIEAVKGRIYSRIGRVTYGPRNPVSCYMWTIEIVTKGKHPRHIGWVCRKSMDKYCVKRNDYRDITYPTEMLSFADEASATAAAGKFETKTRRPVVVKMEKPR